MYYYVMHQCNFTVGEALLRKDMTCQVSNILLTFM